MTTIRSTDVTIVVPTKNEEHNIGRFLRSLPPDVQLILVDSSTDRTRDIAAAARPDNTNVVAAAVNIPEARQLGAELATTPWLLFTDADVVFAPRYFERLATINFAPDDGGVVGAKSTVGGYERYHRWFTRGQGLLHAFGVPAATGSNMMVSAMALQTVGGFDTQLTVNEDSELMFRVRKAGFGVRFEPAQVVASTDHRRLEAGVSRKVLHGAIRNTALYLDILAPRVRRGDWGYWRTADRSVEVGS